MDYEGQRGRPQLTADDPRERGGTDAGPAPYDLLRSALGACSAITLRMYAERKGWTLGTIHVELEHHKRHDGTEHIERRVRFSAPLSDHQGRRADPHHARQGRVRWTEAPEAPVVVRGSASGFAQTVEIGPWRTTADEPITVGGTGTGPTPYELLLAALGSCTSMTSDASWNSRAGFVLGDRRRVGARDRRWSWWQR